MTGDRDVTLTEIDVEAFEHIRISQRIVSKRRGLIEDAHPHRVACIEERDAGSDESRAIIRRRTAREERYPIADLKAGCG